MADERKGMMESGKASSDVRQSKKEKKGGQEKEAGWAFDARDYVSSWSKYLKDLLWHYIPQSVIKQPITQCWLNGVCCVCVFGE